MIKVDVLKQVRHHQSLLSLRLWLKIIQFQEKPWKVIEFGALVGIKKWIQVLVLWKKWRIFAKFTHKSEWDYVNIKMLGGLSYFSWNVCESTAFMLHLKNVLLKNVFVPDTADIMKSLWTAVQIWAWIIRLLNLSL